MLLLEYFPGGQGVHNPIVGAPVAAKYVPKGHEVQDELGRLGEYVPKGHGVQDELGGLEEYEPGAHGVQLEEPGAE